MWMIDCMTAKERLDFNDPVLIDFAYKECMGCGRTSEQISKDEGYTDDDFDNNSRTTLCGNWYHHIDCYTDSH